ncbi:LytR C-terminal domain-containing protein [Embleya sp. NPDC020630]|uniref:LytR C-terminal domain-containing protein n=1 Tax=Embleya sp. NPDC020630 TaxID=3363979 RepID=UPI0037A515D6
MSNDDRRDWEPYGTERGDGGQAREPYGPGRGDGGHPGYPAQPPAGSGPEGLEPVNFAPQQYSYDPNAGYDPNAAYDPNTGYGAGGYDPNAYGSGAYPAANPGQDPNGYGQGAGTYDQSGGYGTGYDPNAGAYAPGAYAPGTYDSTGYPSGGYDTNAYDPNAGYDPNAYNPDAYDPAAPSGQAYPQQGNPGGYPDGQQGGPEPQQPTAYYEQPPAPPAPPAPPVVPVVPVVPASLPGSAASVPVAGTDPTSIGVAAGSTPVRPSRSRSTGAKGDSAPPAARSSTTRAEAGSTGDGRVPPPRTRRPGPGRPGRPGYGSDEFAFVDDESEQAEDVIDWLSFAETRSERRDEKRRAIRTRLIALVVVIAVALLGVGGWFAWDTWLRDDKKVAAPGKNGGVLVQLRGKDGRASANALLTVDPAKNTASMVSVSSVTIVNSDNSSFPLGQLMADEGPGASRDALSDLLGVKLDGSWVVSEPVLQGLVDLAGGIQLNADVEVKGQDGKVLVGQGRNPANGVAALAFATYKQPGESPTVTGDRFGRVLQGLLAAFPTQPDAVLTLLANMANLPDPSLPDDKLSTLLANLAKATQAKLLQVRALPVSPEGILDINAAVPIVRELLGGTVRQGRVEAGPARVMVEDASGKNGAQEDAHAKLLNAGVTYVPGGASGKRAQPTSVVQYSNDARKVDAEQAALTLHLPPTSVKKATGEMLADVVVTLGQDYTFEAPKS